LAVSTICATIRSTFFSIDHFVGLGFPHCQWHTHHVGSTYNCNNTTFILHATVQALQKFSMSYCQYVSNHWIFNFTPNELCAKYSALAPLLPTQVFLWGLSLVTQFVDALSQDLQDLLLAAF
jgi:hypothetical protein